MSDDTATKRPKIDEQGDGEDGSVLVAAVEGGGTTFVLCTARLYPEGVVPPPPPSDPRSDDDDDEDDDDGAVRTLDLAPERLRVLESTSVPTDADDPDETLNACAAWLSARGPFAGLGVACFGPLGLRRSSSKDDDEDEDDAYGRVLESSPKRAWRGADVLGPLSRACGAPPHRLDTDVNAPAAAEFARRDDGRRSSLAYVTVGTGVGVGLVVNGAPVHGATHPEGGHVCVAPLPGDSFEGYSWGRASSPYGGVRTVEGVASSVALAERVAARSAASGDGASSDDRDALALLPDDDDVWDHAANALASLCVSLVLLLSIEEIVLGGGVMKRTILFPKVRARVRELLNGYVTGPPDERLRPATWGNSTGLVGALVLAKTAYESNDE